jgi:hypothetical protein
VGHVLEAGWAAVQIGCRVEDLPGSMLPVQDAGYEFLDVGAYRRRSTGEGDVAAEQTLEANRGLLVLRHTDATDGAAGSHDADRPLVGGHVTDGLDNDVRTVAAGEVADLAIPSSPRSDTTSVAVQEGLVH